MFSPKPGEIKEKYLFVSIQNIPPWWVMSKGRLFSCEGGERCRRKIKSHSKRACERRRGNRTVQLLTCNSGSRKHRGDKENPAMPQRRVKIGLAGWESATVEHWGSAPGAFCCRAKTENLTLSCSLSASFVPSESFFFFVNLTACFVCVFAASKAAGFVPIATSGVLLSSGANMWSSEARNTCCWPHWGSVAACWRHDWTHYSRLWFLTEPDRKGKIKWNWLQVNSWVPERVQTRDSSSGWQWKIDSCLSGSHYVTTTRSSNVERKWWISFLEKEPRVCWESLPEEQRAEIIPERGGGWARRGGTGDGLNAAFFKKVP